MGKRKSMVEKLFEFTEENPDHILWMDNDDWFLTVPIDPDEPDGDTKTVLRGDGPYGRDLLFELLEFHGVNVDMV